MVMSLLVFEAGPLRSAIADRLQAMGSSVRVVSPGEDWFEAALGAGCVVYAPAARLLEGCLDPQPDPARMRRALGASNAPGVGSIVVVVPNGGAYDVELDVLRRHGKPFVIVESPLLFEEVGAHLHETDLWLPRSGRVAACAANAAAEGVATAVEQEPHGRTLAVEAIEMDLATLFKRAAHGSARNVHVHGVPRFLHDVTRPLARLIRGDEPHALALADRLSAATGRRATPPVRNSMPV
jgi:hypothetical protein